MLNEISWKKKELVEFVTVYNCPGSSLNPSEKHQIIKREYLPAGQIPDNQTWCQEHKRMATTKNPRKQP